MQNKIEIFKNILHISLLMLLRTLKKHMKKRQQYLIYTQNEILFI